MSESVYPTSNTSPEKGRISIKTKDTKNEGHEETTDPRGYAWVKP